MNKTWINRKNNEKIILFFNGWGMDENGINHVKTDKFDVVEFHDYRTVEFEEKDNQDYAEIYLIAWSLGVYVASHILKDTTLPIRKSIAINGTTEPVNAKYGIPPAIFKGTLAGWNELNKTRFNRRMLGGKKEFENHQSKLGERTVANQKAELQKLYEYSQLKWEQSLNFDKAIIGKRDVVFPSSNQANFWEQKSFIQHVDMPHYPFLYFSSWEDIITL